MFECKTCGRKFKTMQGLGGHSNVHRKTTGPTAAKGEGESAPAVAVPASVERREPDSTPGAKQTDAQSTVINQPATPAVEKAPGDTAQNGQQYQEPGTGGKTETAIQPAPEKALAPQPRQEPQRDEEPSIADQIRNHRGRGLTFKQLVEELGYSPTTVRDVISKELEAKNESEEEKVSTIPLVIKNGKGEMIAPEAVIWQMAVEDGVNGEKDFRALMKWAAAIEMVHRMTEVRKTEAEALAIMARPVLEMMEKSREELDAAVARAKESSMGIAEAAAAGAAARATMHIDERINELKEVKKEKADIATVPEPVQGVIARTLEMMLNQFTTSMFGGAQNGGMVNPGLVDKRTQ
ncbi:MAG: C2H2-type zinc finger protein [Chloroflexi bacterium]|nr:C2H2-type zinc finger protein [Chloroflexota bacterium]